MQQRIADIEARSAELGNEYKQYGKRIGELERGLIVAGDPATATSVTAAKATGINPVSQAVSYRLAGDLSGNQDPVANWEPIDDAMAGRIGTGITESGGHFSFTETGIYQVQFTGVAYDSGSDDVQINAEIFASSDSGGSYDKLAQGMTNLHHAAQHTFSISTIVDITNTSTNRVKFRIDGNNGVINGNSNETFTFASFVRLGNT